MLADVVADVIDERVQAPRTLSEMLTQMAPVSGGAVGGGPTPSRPSKPGPLAGASDAEIDAAVASSSSNGMMITAPAPQPGAARFVIEPGMMVNEHSVLSTSSVKGATGNVTTKIRVHTPDPKAPAGSQSATVNTVTITQGGRVWVPGAGWVLRSTATSAQMNAAHQPTHD
jgi:hypothetical protein